MANIFCPMMQDILYITYITVLSGLSIMLSRILNKVTSFLGIKDGLHPWELNSTQGGYFDATLSPSTINVLFRVDNKDYRGERNSKM